MDSYYCLGICKDKVEKIKKTGSIVAEKCCPTVVLKYVTFGKRKTTKMQLKPALRTTVFTFRKAQLRRWVLPPSPFLPIFF